MTAAASHLSHIRHNAEQLYEYCSRHIDSSLDNCIKCPLHLACSQARALQYTSLRDLMGMLLFNITADQMLINRLEAESNRREFIAKTEGERK